MPNGSFETAWVGDNDTVVTPFCVFYDPSALTMADDYVYRLDLLRNTCPALSSWRGRSGMCFPLDARLGPDSLSFLVSRPFTSTRPKAMVGCISKAVFCGFSLLLKIFFPYRGRHRPTRPRATVVARQLGQRDVLCHLPIS